MLTAELGNVGLTCG